MKLTNVTRLGLAFRRQKRDLEGKGFVSVSESGDPLWKLYRGDWIGHIIEDVVIGVDGKQIYIRVAEQVARKRGILR